MKKSKYRSIEQIKSRYGLMYITPWAIGFVVFFVVPLIQSLWFSFSDVTITAQGITTEFVGLESYKYYFSEHPYYTVILGEDISSLFYSMPIILLVSVVLALILNQEFRGRLFFRAIYFVPVIVASGVVVKLLFSASDDQLTTSGVSSSLTASMFSVEDVVGWLNLPDKIAEYVKVIINNIFDLLWNCGIQTVLFIAGLQSIPRSLYEASRVEGATVWEEFWFITFPMLGNVTLLVSIFTMVDLFTNNKREIISLAYYQMNSGVYDTTSAALWIYFGVVGFLMAIFLFFFNKFLLKRWQ